jgi:hypothetical protein
VIAAYNASGRYLGGALLHASAQRPNKIHEILGMREVKSARSYGFNCAPEDISI